MKGAASLFSRFDIASDSGFRYSVFSMDLVQVYIARDSMEAHFLRGVLAEEGIAATVMGENLATARGRLPMTPDTLPSVWVAHDEAPRASQIVEGFVATSRDADAGNAPAASKAKWTCPTCGELVEPQFTDCWNCQTPRPE